MSHSPLFILAAICAAAALAEWLGHRGIGRKIGGVMIVIMVAAALANLGVIPSGLQPPPLYGELISTVAPVSIFLLLLDVHLAALKRAGALMLGAFAIGALGTLVGVVVAYWLTNAPVWLGDLAPPIAGMYVATDIGGSSNFNALALHYGVVNHGALYAGANAVDSAIATVWFAALLVLPKIMHAILRTRPEAVERVANELPQAMRTLNLGSLATLLALAFGGHWLSLATSAWLAPAGLAVPSILILTTLALIVAHVPAVQRLGGANLLGTYGSYLFLAVIGAYCDIGSLIQLGHLGGMLVLFVGLAVLIHGVIVFGGGALLRLPPEVMAVASSANIGGSTTVMPIARGLDRMDLLLPGILAGSLGNAIGTYAGFFAVWLLRG